MSSLHFNLLKKGRSKPDNFTNPGRTEMPNYAWTINEHGEEILAVKNYTNIQEMINASHDDVALPVLIKRFMAGDDKALSKMQAHAFYDDITSLPSNMHDAHRLMVEMRNDFDNLAYEDRAFFNNDFNQFINSVGNGNFLAFLEKRANVDLDGDGFIADKKVIKDDIVADAVDDVKSNVKDGVNNE